MSLLLSIDPGLVNFGWTVMDRETRLLVDSGIVRVRNWDDDDVISAQKILALAQTLTDAYPLRLLLIECQGMSQILKGIQQATITAFLALGVPAKIVYPQTIKAHFRSRGLGFRGNRQNKRDAEALVVRLGYDACVSHVADCILMAIYEWETTLGQPEI